MPIVERDGELTTIGRRLGEVLFGVGHPLIALAATGPA